MWTKSLYLTKRKSKNLHFLATVRYVSCKIGNTYVYNKYVMFLSTFSIVPNNKFSI